MVSRFTERELDLIDKGLHLFNEQKYWECHEELEHHWLEEPGPMRNIYWAIIQVAASMIHYRESNLVGARGLIVKAKEKIMRVKDMNLENELLNNALDWQEFKGLVNAIPDNPALVDFEKMFEFRFKKFILIAV